MKTLLDRKIDPSFKTWLFILGYLLLNSFWSFGQALPYSEGFSDAADTWTTYVGMNAALVNPSDNNWTLTTTGSPDVTGTDDHCKVIASTLEWRDIAGSSANYVEWFSKTITTVPYDLVTVSMSYTVDGQAISPNSQLTFYYNLDGTGWVQFDNKTSAGLTSGLVSVSNLTFTNTIQVKVKGFTGDAGNAICRIDNVSITGTIDCVWPTNQASNLSISNIGCNSLDLSWTGGNGNNVLITARSSTATLSDPTKGTAYTASSTYAGGGASQIGSGNWVIYNAASVVSNTTAVSGLVSNTSYSFSIYEYNTTGTCYNTTELLGVQATIGAPLTVTTYNPADNSSGSLTQNITLTFNENIQAGTSGTITIIKPGPAVFETIAYNSSNLTFSGNQLIINPTNPFVANAVYTVQIASTAVKGMCTNSYAGISTFTDWNFTAVSPKKYYVNDNSTTGDIYTTAVGINSSGKGTASATPALTLSWLLNSSGYTFVFGDTIFIDAGIYAKGGTPSVTTESKFNITVSGLTFIGAGMGVTTFSNNFHGGGTDYFMQINANNTTVKNMTFTKYYGGAPNSGTVYNGINTGGQVLSIYNATGVVIENVSLFDNGTNGNAAIAIGPNSTVLLKGGGSNCNATGSSYSGGIDAIGNAINLTIQNVIIAYNSKTAFGGAGLYVYSIHNTNVVNVKNSAIINNIGGQGGGAGVYCNGGNVTIRESSILSNTVSTSGGPYYVGAGIGIVSGTMTLTKCKISDNKSFGASTTSFGGVGLTPSSGNVTLKIDSCSFSGNTGQRTTGNDIGARINGSNKFSITINETTFSAGAIDIGGGSTNSCAGNTFKITNSGNPTITYSGSGPCALGAGSNISSPYTFASPTIPSFTGNCTNFIILPIELTRFEGECSNGQVILNWQTASEINNSEFKIERSTNGIDFETIGSVISLGASGRINNYSYIDEDNLDVTCYYRLTQKDFDGKTSSSKIISVEHACARKLNSEIITYPNPSNDYVVLDIKLYQTSLVSIDIVNEIGRTIKKYDANKYDIGMTSINLDISKLNAGIYFLKVLVNDQPTIQKLVKL